MSYLVVFVIWGLCLVFTIWLNFLIIIVSACRYINNIEFSLYFSYLLLDYLTERELFRVVPLIPRLLSITNHNTTTSASQRVPENPVKLWDTFHSDAFTASLLISGGKKFNSPEIIQPTASIESTIIKLFLRTMEQINNQRLKCLSKPAR